MTTIVKNLSSDFGGSIRLHILNQEIDNDEIITTTLTGILVDSGNVSIIFAGTLSGAEITQLDILITAHDGTEIDPVIDIKSTGTDNTTATLVINQTADRTITFPDVTDTLVCIDAAQTLSNKKISDAVLVDSGDITKTINFDISGATTSSELTLHGVQTSSIDINFPIESDTLAGLSSTQTLIKSWKADLLISRIRLKSLQFH